MAEHRETVQSRMWEDTSMAKNIAHFDIAADDVERARRFYERVFGWRCEDWGPPDFYLIHTGTAGDPGIHGSVSKRLHPVAGRGRIGYECTISVEDLAAIKAAIVANGGKILLDEHEIVGVGTLIRFEDTEGNVVCAMRYVDG
jgi:predicted enzyme related to lactoylglutathione lyase